MTVLPSLQSLSRRRAVRTAGLLVAVATFALCAYAGGQPRASQPAQARGGTTLTAVKGRAKSGKPAMRGPSANVGQPVKLIGTGFDENVSVQFTSFANSTFLVRPTEVKNRRVTVPVPAVAATGPVLLSDPESGQSKTLTLQVVPTITSLSTASTTVGGRVLIDGTGFSVGSKVSFRGVSAPVEPTIVSPTRIDVLVPAGAQTGKIAVVTEGGTSKGVKLTIMGSAQ